MTCPRPNPFKLHFLPGMEEGRFSQIKAHTKREYGWLPNAGSKLRSKRKKKKKR